MAEEENVPGVQEMRPKIFGSNGASCLQHTLKWYGRGKLIVLFLQFFCRFEEKQPHPQKRQHDQNIRESIKIRQSQVIQITLISDADDNTFA